MPEEVVAFDTAMKEILLIKSTGKSEKIAAKLAHNVDNTSQAILEATKKRHTK